MELFSSDFFVVWSAYLKPLSLWTVLTVLSFDLIIRHLIKTQSEEVDNTDKITMMEGIQRVNFRAIAAAVGVSALLVVMSNAFMPQLNKRDYSDLPVVQQRIEQRAENAKPIVDTMRKNDLTKEERQKRFEELVNREGVK